MHSLRPEAEHQVFLYDRNRLSSLLASVIQGNVSAEAWEWLHRQSLQATNAGIFNAAFSMMPRKTGRKVINVSSEQEELMQEILPHFSIKAWSGDRLCRVWLLMHLDATDQLEYKKRIENLFVAADMNELVALYSSLPLLAYGEIWKLRCAEGIRSNIGDVLEAIMCRNLYPFTYLDTAAWNQMVLKAFFTDKPVHQIVGLESRNNPELASILIDYAHERYAAQRPVNPLLWRCVGPYINEENLTDIRKLLSSDNKVEREAGALACFDSNYVPARDLLCQYPHLKERIEKGEVTWETIASHK